jgi:hypothetical protein
MASKAARQEPTLREYHIGKRVAGRGRLAERCVLSRKARQLDRYFRQRRMRASSWGSVGSRSRFEEAWPVVNEQTENRAREEESENNSPAIIMREVYR